MTLEGIDASDRILLSYDASGTARSAAVRVCQIIFGRARNANPDGDGHRTAGFIHRPGVVWIGQSVLVLPTRDARELEGRLRRLGVRVAMAPVSIGRSGLEAFRRPG